MPGDMYAEMERILRRQVASHRSFRARLVEIATIVATIFTLAFLLYVAQFSGTVRWFLGLAVIALVSLYIWGAVAKETLEPRPLTVPPRPLRVQPGELTRLTAVVHRANEDLPYSQVIVSSRAREAFEERARLAKGLSPEAMRQLRGDRAALRAAFRDITLADFLYLPTADSDARSRWVSEKAAGEGFVTAFPRILDRMEEWR